MSQNTLRYPEVGNCVGIKKLHTMPQSALICLFEDSLDEFRVPDAVVPMKCDTKAR